MGNNVKLTWHTEKRRLGDLIEWDKNPRQLKEHDAEHLEKVRKMHCLVCGLQGEPHHLKAIGMGRNRKREMLEHYTAIPLCHNHHIEIETIGVERFNSLHRIDVWREAFRILTGI